MGVGRFGWKNQHRSLESFSADAYLNEMGITSPLFPDENTSSGRFVGFGTRYAGGCTSGHSIMGMSNLATMRYPSPRTRART